MLPIIALGLLIALGLQIKTVANFGEVTAVAYVKPAADTAGIPVPDTTADDAASESTEDTSATTETTESIAESTA